MFWNKKPQPQHEPANEQAVIVSFDVDDNEYVAVQKQIITLTDGLEAALQEIGAEYDGDEYGDNECTLYFYGPDAGKVYELVSAAMSSFEVRPIRFTLRFGEASDPSAKEEQRRLV